jgi:hypothetical protein
MFICSMLYVSTYRASGGINPMPQLKVPQHVIDDLNRFISATYQHDLPNSLLIAQAFILKHPDHGRKYGLPTINRIVEDGIKEGLF